MLPPWQIRATWLLLGTSSLMSNWIGSKFMMTSRATQQQAKEARSPYAMDRNTDRWCVLARSIRSIRAIGTILAGRPSLSAGLIE